MKHLRTIAAAGLLAATVLPAAAADITGAGSTFVYPVLAKWADVYKKDTGVGLNYQSIGSGGGIKQITAKTVTFGATDMPLKPEDVAKNGLVQFPIINGGVVPVRQSAGHQAGRTDARRPDARQDLSRRDHQVERSRRSRSSIPASSCPTRRLRSCTARTVPAPPSSGPTISPRSARTGKSKVGENTAVEWPVGIGAKGNEGVANNTAKTVGAIGYVEYAYAKQNNLTYAKMVNQAGKVVAPTAESFQAAAASADWANAPGFLRHPDRRSRATSPGRSPARPSS